MIENYSQLINNAEKKLKKISSQKRNINKKLKEIYQMEKQYNQIIKNNPSHAL